jgi:Bacteriophage HK97-gp10, putative tail-component
MPMKLETRGLDEIQGVLKLMREASISQAAKDACRRGARVMAAEQKLRAPLLDAKTAESTALDPGTLRDSIRVYVRRMGDGVIRAWIGPNMRGKKTNVAHLVEYGHRLVKGGKSRVGITGAAGPGHEIGDVPAHPFLRPAFEASWQAALDAVADEFRHWLMNAGQR